MSTTPGGGTEMEAVKRIALVAHDSAKDALVLWATRWRETLVRHQLYATGTTGGRLRAEVGLGVHCYLSGPLGGDAQLGAAIAEGRLDILFFFIDPLAAQPHDVDVKALIRLATLHETPIAMNAASADFVITSPFFASAYSLPSAAAGKA